MNKLNLQNARIFDTETTGLGKNAEICEITIIDAVTGDVCFSSLVQPRHPIPQDAIDIHGITNEMVSNALSFDVVYEQIKSMGLLGNLIAYNADYDTRLVIQSLQARAYRRTPIEIGARCAMKWYAQFYGEFNEWHQTYKWQSLTNACAQQNIDVSDLNAHRALADCEMTRRLIHSVNAKMGA